MFFAKGVAFQFTVRQKRENDLRAFGQAAPELTNQLEERVQALLDGLMAPTDRTFDPVRIDED